jgi:hypothetical protein
MRMIIAVLLPLGLAIAAGQVRAAGKWKKHGSKNGVVVFVKEVEGSDVPRVRGKTVVDASTDEVWEGLSKILKKSKGVKKIKVLGTCGEGCRFVYQRLGHPLIKDRHYVLEMRESVSEQDGLRTYRRSWKKTAKKPLPGSSALEVEKVSGSWKLVPVDAGARTRITYINHMDLGGSVPDGLFSKGFVENAYKLLGKLRKSF